VWLSTPGRGEPHVAGPPAVGVDPPQERSGSSPSALVEMGLKQWTARTQERIQERGVAGTTESLYELYSGAWRYLGWHVPRGTNVYEREWDLLVILDACRVDLLREVAGDYDFLTGVESVESVGSMSEEWMAKTFTGEHGEEIRETAYVTANVFSAEVLEATPFRVLDEVWRYGWSDEEGTVPPGPVTDRAIAVAREHDPERQIVHYMQPHHPFVGAANAGEFEADPFGREGGETVVDALRRGKITRDAFWAAYRENLRIVLRDVSVLLSNVDAETVAVTADHGDALGEWGIYDHPAGCLHPVVKNVPWTETTARDTGEYEPTVEPAESRTDVDNRLRDLGYL